MQKHNEKFHVVTYDLSAWYRYKSIIKKELENHKNNIDKLLKN